MKKVKIYTRDGDGGTSSLFGGQRVDKSSARLEAYGTIDELNSQLGVVLSESPSADIAKKLIRIQSELMVLGADLATPDTAGIKVPRIGKSHIVRLEEEIDSWDKKLPDIVNFILPGGGKIGAALHLARTITRRAERRIAALSKEEKIGSNVLPYINRLSDWFFVLARYANHLDKKSEVIWKGRK